MNLYFDNLFALLMVLLPLKAILVAVGNGRKYKSYQNTIDQLKIATTRMKT